MTESKAEGAALAFLRELVDHWGPLYDDPDEPISGSDLVEEFAGIVARGRAILADAAHPLERMATLHRYQCDNQNCDNTWETTEEYDDSCRCPRCDEAADPVESIPLYGRRKAVRS